MIGLYGSRYCGYYGYSIIILQMVKGFILVKLIPGFESSALSVIRTIPGVLEVNLVFGQWDAIIVASAKSLFQLSKVVISDIRNIQGVQDTTTLVQSEL